MEERDASGGLLILARARRRDDNAIQVSLMQTMRLLVSTSCNISHEHPDGVKLRAPLRPFASAFDNRDVTVDR